MRAVVEHHVAAALQDHDQVVSRSGGAARWRQSAARARSADRARPRTTSRDPGPWHGRAFRAQAHTAAVGSHPWRTASRRSSPGRRRPRRGSPRCRRRRRSVRRSRRPARGAARSALALVRRQRADACRQVARRVDLAERSCGTVTLEIRPAVLHRLVVPHHEVTRAPRVDESGPPAGRGGRTSTSRSSWLSSSGSSTISRVCCSHT